MSRGIFITFEGIDGAGKSGHIDTVARLLQSRGYTTVVTREPGGTPLADKLRSLVLNDAMDPLTEALLMFAARRDHIQRVIEPALAAGEAVIFDRFTDSTLAYQGGGRGFDQDVLNTLREWVHGALQPDITLWFDLDPAIAAKRLEKARAPDRFESEMTGFFEAVRTGYSNAFANKDGTLQGRVLKVDAGQSPEAVRQDVLAMVCTRLGALAQVELAQSHGFMSEDLGDEPAGGHPRSREASA